MALTLKQIKEFITESSPDNADLLLIQKDSDDSYKSLTLSTLSQLIITENLSKFSLSEDVADEAVLSQDIPVGDNGGFGTILAEPEWADIVFDKNGNVELRNQSSNVSTTDTDGNLVIMQNGTSDGVTVKNRLGSNKRILASTESH